MKIPKYFCFLLFFIPLLSLRDFTPNNELKYLSIADEAIRNSHFFAFWNHGAAYADKPPLYLWIVREMAAGRTLYAIYQSILYNSGFSHTLCYG